MRAILPMPKGSKATIFDVMQYSQWKHRTPDERKVIGYQPNVLFIVYNQLHYHHSLIIIK